MDEPDATDATVKYEVAPEDPVLADSPRKPTPTVDDDVRTDDTEDQDDDQDDDRDEDLVWDAGLGSAALRSLTAAYASPGMEALRASQARLAAHASEALGGAIGASWLKSADLGGAASIFKGAEGAESVRRVLGGTASILESTEAMASARRALGESTAIRASMKDLASTRDVISGAYVKLLGQTAAERGAFSLTSGLKFSDTLSAKMLGSPIANIEPKAIQSLTHTIAKSLGPLELSIESANMGIEKSSFGSRLVCKPGM